MTNPWNGRYVPAVIGLITGAALFGTTNISCGDVQSACAADCPDTAALETKIATLEETVTMLQTQHELLKNGLTRALAIERLVCTPGQRLEWSGEQWECADNIWLAQINRPATDTISYSLPDGTTETLNVGNGLADATGMQIGYRPNGAGDARLYFALKGAPSLACTLLHDEDDALRVGRYMATDSGNGQEAIWGNLTTPTFILAREAVDNFVLGVNESHTIACFPK